MDVNSLISNFRTVVTEHYFDFEGRARRQTYWYYVLVYFIIAVVLGIVQGVVHMGSLLTSLLSLALLCPSLGLGVRRLHDINMSGWWVLIGIIPFIGWAIVIYWACQPGTAGANQFGADPKAVAA